MRRLLIIFFILLGGAVADAAAQDMRALFLDAPDERFPLLTKSRRADCVDYIDAGMEARVTNVFDGESVLRVLTPDFFYLETTPTSSVQGRLLPVGGDSVICLVESVRAQAEGSRVAFFNRTWESLSHKEYFAAPAISDFFISADSAELYSDKCDIYLVSLTLARDEHTLTAEYTMPAYMSVDDAVLVKPLLRKIVYRWNGRKFVRE